MKNKMDMNSIKNIIEQKIDEINTSCCICQRPDVTILDSEHLTIKPSGGKGFEFDGDLILFELKFIEIKQGLLKEQLKVQLRMTMKKFKNYSEN